VIPNDMLSHLDLQCLITVDSYLISNSTTEINSKLQVKFEVAQKLLQNSSSFSQYSKTIICSGKQHHLFAKMGYSN
jgi:hypothetical protein